MPVFLEIPGFGLSNRIRTILAYEYIARRQKRGQLYIFWLNTSSCPEHYNQLFEAIPGVTLITDLDEFRKLRKANPKALYFRGQGQFQTLVKRATGISLNGSLNPRGLELNIFKDSYTKLKPLPDIWAKIQSFIQEHKINECWGLHIRRTDHVNFIVKVRGHYDNDAHFEQIIKQNPTRRFYLSTDNLTTQQKFLNQFPTQIVVYTSIPNVNSVRKTSVEHAVIDLFLLGNCGRLFGSFGSSFSEFAYRLGMVYNKNSNNSDRIDNSNLDRNRTPKNKNKHKNKNQDSSHRHNEKPKHHKNRGHSNDSLYIPASRRR